MFYLAIGSLAHPPILIGVFLPVFGIVLDHEIENEIISKTNNAKAAIIECFLIIQSGLMGSLSNVLFYCVQQRRQPPDG